MFQEVTQILSGDLQGKVVLIAYYPISLWHSDTWFPVGGRLRCGLGGGMPLELGFEVSKDLSHFKLALSAVCRLRCELSVAALVLPACCHVAHHYGGGLLSL